MTTANVRNEVPTYHMVPDLRHPRTWHVVRGNRDQGWDIVGRWVVRKHLVCERWFIEGPLGFDEIARTGYKTRAHALVAGVKLMEDRK